MYWSVGRNYRMLFHSKFLFLSSFWNFVVIVMILCWAFFVNLEFVYMWFLWWVGNSRPCVCQHIWYKMTIYRFFYFRVVFFHKMHSIVACILSLFIWYFRLFYVFNRMHLSLLLSSMNLLWYDIGIACCNQMQNSTSC